MQHRLLSLEALAASDHVSFPLTLPGNLRLVGRVQNTFLPNDCWQPRDSPDLSETSAFRRWTLLRGQGQLITADWLCKSLMLNGGIAWGYSRAEATNYGPCCWPGSLLRGVGAILEKRCNPKYHGANRRPHDCANGRADQ